jgi:acyl-homoserine lactone acylase PvdQ
VTQAPANGDYAGQAYNILAPGESGGIPADAHSTDQAKLYDALTPLQGHVTAADIKRLYKSESFGVKGPVVRTESTGRPGLTIKRDSFNVPHVYGKTRDDVTFGAGFVAAEDRGLLLAEARGAAYVAALDVPGINAFGLVTSLRTFTPSPAAIKFVADQTKVLTDLGAKGRQVLRDFQSWVNGVNAFYTLKVPAASRPAPYTLADAIAAFAFIGSIFGNGGGNEVGNSNLLAGLEAKFGPGPGLSVFRDLKESNDLDAPVSSPGTFPYLTVPTGATPGAAVIDPGSLDQTGVTSAAAARSSQRLMSNAILVSAKRSATGHPLAVMGPQLGYYYPEIVMEADLHGGGIDARGAIPPVQPYILIGRGKDFAWSLTSASNDNVDQFLEQLCNANGSAPTRASTSYMYKGTCTPLTTFDAGLLKGAGGQPDQELVFRESVHGPITGTVTVGGKPYAVSRDRATRGREPAGALAFADLNTNKVHDPKSFFKAANEFDTTFNWHYVDSKHIADFSSGRLPVRAPGTDPALPTFGTGQYDWRGFLTQNQHPHAVDPSGGLILNWNNKPAKGWGAADNTFSYGALHRVQMFNGFKKKGNRLADVVSIVNRAATQDRRALQVWPVISKVLAGSAAPSPLAQQAADLVSAWAAHGASRLDANLDGKIDDPGAAVLDAAWTPLAEAVLSPVLGTLTPQFESLYGPNDNAGPGGSSYGGGWEGYVYKDLGTQLGMHFASPFSRRYCGNGDLNVCRAALWAVMQTAATNLATAQGSDPSAWRADATGERIKFLPGLIPDTMRWTNRSTFQQVITFSRHR